MDKRLRLVGGDKTREQDEKSRALLDLLSRYSMVEEYKLRILNNKYSYSLIKFRPVAESEVSRRADIESE